jgi:hypothetical protein
MGVHGPFMPTRSVQLPNLQLTIEGCHVNVIIVYTTQICLRYVESWSYSWINVLHNCMTALSHVYEIGDIIYILFSVIFFSKKNVIFLHNLHHVVDER